METKPKRYPIFVAVKMPSELAADVRRAADADDRTVSAYLRRIIAAAVRPAAARDAETR